MTCDDDVLSSGVQRRVDGVVQQEDVPADGAVAALGAVAAELHREALQDLHGAELGVALPQRLTRKTGHLRDTFGTK